MAADDPIQDADTNIDPGTAASPSSDAATSEPTPVDTTNTTTTSGDEPTDLLSAVRAVLKPDAADPSPAEGSGADAPASGSGSGQPDPNATTTDPEQPRELTAADFADVEKPSVKKRIDTLLAQRGAARSEIEAMREPATYWQQHVQFLQSNNITPDQTQQLYGVAQLIARGDWSNAAAAIRPWYELALRQMGEILPEDIQRRVDTGDISPEDARELSRAKAAAANAQQQRAVSEHQYGAVEQQRQIEGVRAALSQWEQDISQRDPDFALKRDAVMRYAQAMRAERGLPPDPTTAMRWANEALGEVNKLFTAARPQPQATRAGPSSGTSVTKARAEPRSLLDAARYALEDMRT